MARLPSRARATSVAAPAPNRRIIGGAGTCVPPVELEDEPEDPPLDEELPEVDELPDVEELPDEEPLVLPLADEPKLLDPVLAPELELVDPLVPELVELDEELPEEP
ncbi:MAG TPA: hypothetical protein VEW04_02760 [Allosphingosinicella sp.]|nr:hypothetical protein [Allosphingosinicella sp.]